jgi:hypothetical protein
LNSEASPGSTTGTATEKITASSPKKPAYFLVQVKAKSMEELNTRYAVFAIPSLMKIGGEMIAGSPTPKVLEDF